jgi:hypothetical protein
MTGDAGEHEMSSLSADPHETTTTGVQLQRAQYRWATMLRRADARESALTSALEHARAKEQRLQSQLEEQQRRHTIESRVLRDRLQRLEQCLLSYATTARKALSAPLAAMRDSGKLLSPAGQSPTRPRLIAMPATEAPAIVSIPSAVTPAPLVPAPATPSLAPFDPVAIVASMLPLDEVRTAAPEGDLVGALDRMRGIVGKPDLLLEEGLPRPLSLTPAPARPYALMPAPSAPPAPIDEEQPERHLAGVEQPSTRECGGDAETPWFPRAFRRLAEEDPEAAGRLLLQLLPAQGLVWPEDVTYRIEVAETGTLAVSVRGGHSTVLPLLEASEARTGEATLRCDLAGLARAAVVRRGWSRVGARIAAARNRHLRPLRALAAAPLQLSDIKRTGAEPDPLLLLRLLALAVDPVWTAKDTFTVACRWRGRTQSGCYIHIVESAPVAVSSTPPLGRVTATLTCEPGDLLDILSGAIPLDHSLAKVSGDHPTLARLLEWLQRVDATATKIPADKIERALAEV